MKNVLINELKGFFRSRLFILLSVIFIFSLALSTYLGIIQNKKLKNSQKEAKEHIRKQWDEMGASNPHRAAHFGSYAFKETTILNSIDEGVNSLTGNVLRLEGHKQNDVMFSEASQSLMISKMGKLKPSLLFQFLIPLFLIFLSFNSYSKERESGRLKLILIQGISLKSLIFSKIFSIWLIGFFLLLSSVLVQFIFNSIALDFDTFLRLLMLIISYSLYYLIIINLSVAVSVFFKNSTSALSMTIVVWFMWSVFFPKIIGNSVEKIHPLPTRVEFQESMSEDRKKGIDGHNPLGEVKKELEKATLAKYKVDNLSQLPINFSGILMQADEDYGNKVWDKHFGELYSQLNKQKQKYQISGFFNPFSSIQNLSMALSGTDMYHHLDFLNQGEKYRRIFIKALNEKYTETKMADANFFKSVKDFDYQFPLLISLLHKYILDFIALFFWLVTSIITLNFLTKK